MFRKALEWFCDQGVDAVAVCGDMADTGMLAELQAVAQTWSAVFPNDMAPDGRHVERLFIYGNHDYGGRIPSSARLQAVREGRQRDVLRQGVEDDVQALPRDPRRRKCQQGRLDHCGEVNSLDRITHEDFQLPLAKVRTFGIISSNNAREK